MTFVRSKLKRTILLSLFCVLIVKQSVLGVTIDSVSPAWGEPNESLTVTISGNGFDSSTRVFLLKDHENEKAAISSLDIPGYAKGVHASGSRAYVAEWGSGLQIIDASDPLSPAIIGSVETNHGNDVVVVGEQAYVVGSGSGFNIIDISNPSDPTIIGSKEIKNSQQLFLDENKVYIKTSYAYAIPSHGVIRGYGLVVLDISEPSNPMTLSNQTMAYDYNLCASGDAVYISGHTELKILDYKELTNPIELGSLSIPGGANGIYLSGKTVYMAGGYSGFQIIDVSDSTSPAIIGSLGTGAYLQGVQVVESLAYVWDGYGTFQVIDVSDLESPVLVQSIELENSIADAFVSGNTAYIANGSEGFSILSLPLKVETTTVWSENLIACTLPTTSLAGNYTIRVINSSGTAEAKAAITYADNIPDQVISFVTRFYEKCLDRSPETEGLKHWVDDLTNAQVTGADLARGFILSQEFVNRDLSDQDFLTILYQAFFNRAPDDGGYNVWLTLLQGNYSRTDVLDNFTHSAEFINLCTEYDITVF